jgi:hypothetical protein
MKNVRQDSDPNEPDHIVFYWSGHVPVIAELGIRSALNRSETSAVHLFLDSGAGVQSSLPKSLNWLQSCSRFHIHHFSLQAWLKEYEEGRASNPLAEKIQPVLERWASRFLAPRSLEKLSRYGLAKRFIGHWHPDFGWFPSSAVDVALSEKGVTYRADVFRILIASKFPRESILYSDLDVYFATPLKRWGLNNAFLYRWGMGEQWANNAIIYYPRERARLSSFLTRELLRGTPARPWFIFSEENCRKAGIEIWDTELFEPAWTKGSVSRGDTSMFMEDTPTTSQLVDEIDCRFLAVHWHNQRGKSPPKGSPFAIFLGRERASTEHT